MRYQNKKYKRQKDKQNKKTLQLSVDVTKHYFLSFGRVIYIMVKDGLDWRTLDRLISK